MKLVPHTDWPRLLGRRIKVGVVLKSLGIPLFTALFFVGYFHLLDHPFGTVRVMPMTAIDGWIPYWVWAWLPYVSLWIYVQLPPTFIANRRELVYYGLAAAAVSLTGFAFFYFWPTAVPALPVEAGAAPGLANIRNLDTTGNSCPSLHVAFSLFSAVWIDRHLRLAGVAALLRWVNVVWCLAIVYSTLGTKQHVFWDVCGGSILGFAGAWLQARLERHVRAGNPSLACTGVEGPAVVAAAGGRQS
jgi:membrane-associated phospholipid phosphatase